MAGNKFDPEIESARATHDGERTAALAAFDTDPRVTCSRCGGEFRDDETRIVPGPTEWAPRAPFVGVSLCRADAADLDEAIRVLDLHKRENPIPTENPFARPE